MSKRRMGRILVTGANGFVGRALISKLLEQDYPVLAVSREKSSHDSRVDQIEISDVSDWCNWTEKLKNIDVIVHTAARVHVIQDASSDGSSEYKRVNTDATLQLASQAARAGVKRFVFLSTIKVNGESTSPGKPFSEKDLCSPTDPYGLSKWRAEQGLLELAKTTGMEVVIIRPPLIYGPGVKGNFASMMKCVSKGLPLPLAAVKNQRSLLAIDNLVSFIISCLEHDKARNEVFLLSDNEDLSMPDIIRKLAHSQGRRPRLIPIPVSVMNLFARVIGKSDVAERLFGSLQIDSTKARDLIGWSPVVSVDEQLNKIF